MAAEAPLRWPLSALDPRDLLDGLAMAVVVLDPRGDIAYLNAAAQTMLAAGLNQYRGRPLRELVRDPAPLESIIIRAQQSQEPIANREISLTPTMRSDSQFVVDCTASPLGPDGRVLLEISDTTRQQRISRDNALLTQLGGSRMMVRQLAHEIKNPLGGLRGAAQLLERELPDAALKEYTRIIISEADRLRALVDNLLGPGYPPRNELVNVHELTQHVFQLVRSEVPGGITITRDYDPSLPQLYLDRDQLIQAMLNLARNAVQVLGTTGQLVIRTRAVTNVTIGATRHRVVAAVQFEDNGPGVPAELKDKIFYPLVTGRPGGTGLGLAVAQDIVTRHDGLIEYESRPGHTVFTILLPLGDAHGG